MNLSSNSGQEALDALRRRLERIHVASLDGRPKQAYGEMVSAMLNMPEWKMIMDALSSHTEVANDAARNGLPDKASGSLYLDVIRSKIVDSNYEVLFAAHAAIQTAVRAERESCAKICENAINNIGPAEVIGHQQRETAINVCRNLAYSIRNQPE